MPGVEMGHMSSRTATVHGTDVQDVGTLMYGGHVDINMWELLKCGKAIRGYSHVGKLMCECIDWGGAGQGRVHAVPAQCIMG